MIAAKLGGFSAAASQLNVSPAYVSKRIGLLEKQLKVKLFLRSSRQVTLTLEGKVALKWSMQILDAAERMFVDINYEHEVPRGSLRITTSTGFGSQCIAPIISELVRNYPELSVDLELLDRPVGLLEEGFDLEIKIGGELPQNMIAKKLAVNSRIICSSSRYISEHGEPRTVAELKDHTCISIRERDQHYQSWQLDGKNGKASIDFYRKLSTNNGLVAKQWCIDGHGVMLRSIWNVKDEITKGKLIRILPDFEQQADIHAIFPVRLETSAKLKVCVNLLKSRLPIYL
ncbi:LysR family transcriptional regulator [Vibrio penaeicida]|uniref:LysR family transcriptional regulator n=1 Tax=Vibrio penaeicida TaxID=104609 RepID=A0AAV5NV91_9VIBR|nr:LysR family transcriptional regulator [Vibrio penaeicida]GLQ74375.1 LysR family transcriptional regulator [Vibrio penaeicida]